MKTTCPQCLTRWNGTIDQILLNDRVCLVCKPTTMILPSPRNLFDMIKGTGEFWTWDTLPKNRKEAHEKICEQVRPPDTILLSWIQVMPNPRLHNVVKAWTQCLGGLSLRDAITYCIDNCSDCMK